MTHTIQSLWIGKSLSRIEILSINSFIANGHDFDLFCYDDVANIPPKVYVKDANSVIPREQIFKARDGYALFADYFRSVLLHKHGGTWVDTDVVCLKQFDFGDDIVIGAERTGIAGNAIMQLPQSSSISAHLVKQCEKPWLFLEADVVETIEESNSSTIGDLLESDGEEYVRQLCYGHAPWGSIGGPAALTKIMNDLDLINLLKPTDFFYPIPYYAWWSFFYDNSMDLIDFSNSYAIHLWRECFKGYHQFSSERFQKGSLIEKLWGQYC